VKPQNRRQFLKHTAAAAAFAAKFIPSAASAQPDTKTSSGVKVRALLIHITHYDPNWNANKDTEQPFSYSVPMKDLQLLADTARQKNIDFVPKCNLSKSGRNHHDMWMRPHWDGIHWLKNMDEYWQVAGDVIDELVSVCKPQKYFHIGMDEDHYRSVSQYVDAIKILHAKVGKHNLKTVMWNDTCYENRNVGAQVYADKCRAAEPLLPKDMVHILWDYDLTHKGIVRRLTDMGFEVWVAPGRNKNQIAQWKKILLTEGGTGMLMTNWIKCSKKKQPRILTMLNNLAPAYK